MADFATAVHAAHVIKPIQTIITGVPMLTLLISNTLTALVAAGLAWYIRGRGMAGVKIDLANAKNEIEKLKATVTS